MSRLPYSMMPNLGILKTGDIVPCLRPPFSEGTAFVDDIKKFVRPYSVFTALIKKVNFGEDYPPEYIQILENDILAGVPTLTRYTDGIYDLTFASACLTEGRTFIIVNMWGDDGSTPLNGSGIWVDNTTIRFANNVSYDSFWYCSLEIRVYYTIES